MAVSCAPIPDLRFYLLVMAAAEAEPFQSARTRPASLGNRAGARDVERMVDEPFHLLHELQGIRELCVRVECRLIAPL